MDIGKKLQDLRKQHGLSQRELASRAGLTNGTVSLIEQNKTSPSIASLKSLLDAIPMSVAEFFSTLEESEEEKFFFTADEFTEVSPGGDQGALSLRQLGNAMSHTLQILDENYPPSADTGTKMMTHAGEEAGVVISGEVEITVGEQIKVLRAGEGYIFDSKHPHRFRNTSKKNCRIISACTPPTF